MATNRDLLKEAIADAKAVKETAIANAKAALEEAFTPFLKERLSAKLTEMDEMGDSELEETEMDKMEAKMDDEGTMMDEVSLDELLAELDETSTEDESVYEAEEGEEEEMNIEDMTEDDLKHFIEDVIKDMVSAGELEAGHEGEEGMEGEEGEEGMEMGGEEEAGEMELDEEFDINELLAELEEGGAYTKKAKDPSPKSKNAIFHKDGDEYVTDKTEEDDAPISKGKAEKLSFEEGQLNEDVFNAEFFNTLYASAGAVKLAMGVIGALIGGSLASSFKDELAAAYKQGKDAFVSKIKDIITSKGKKSEKSTSDMSEETLAELETLRSELNEVNLLNAKLLYTNKIFRNKSLNESQKVKVLTAFDKATSKKEVELVYETLLESLKVTTKAPIKESMGSASKVLGGTTSKPIIENDAFARMRELAFGRNK